MNMQKISMVKPDRKKSAIIWVQKLGIFGILSFILRSLFTKMIVYYDSSMLEGISDSCF